MRASSRIIFSLNGLSLGLMLPILSMALIYKGFSLGELAVVMGIFSLSVILVEVPSGILADIFGRKRIFMLAGVLNIAGAVLMLFLNGYWTIIALALWGGGKAFTSGSLEALVIDRFIEEKGKEKLSRITGELALIETVSLAAGSFLGGFLPDLCGKILPGMGMYDLSFIAKCVLTAVVLLLTAVFVKDETQIKGEERPDLKEYIKKSVLFVKDSRIVLLITAGVFCGGFFLSTVETYWQPEFSKLSGGNMLYLLGIVTCACFAFASAGNIAMKAALNKKISRWTESYNIARILLGVCMIGMALSNSPIWFGVSFCLLYFLFGAANVAESTLLNREIPDKIRAGFLSFISFAFQGGGLVSPVFSSLVVVKQGIPALWLYTGIFLLASSLAIGLLMRAKPKEAALKNAAE